MLARSGLVGKNNSWPYLGPFEAFFPWPRKMTEEKEQLQFVHNFHGVSDVATEWSNWEMLYPIFNVLKANTFVRVKANNIPRTEKIIKHGFHADTRVVLSYTAIYYLSLIHI